MQSKSGPTDIQKRTEARQLSELEKLKGIEAKKTAAASRRTRGRASLVSGSERGVTSEEEQRQFAATNKETSAILGVRRRKEDLRQSLITETTKIADATHEAGVRTKEKQTDFGRDVLDPARGVAKQLGLIKPKRGSLW